MLDSDKMIYEAAIRLLHECNFSENSLTDQNKPKVQIEWAVRTARETMQEVIRTEGK